MTEQNKKRRSLLAVFSATILPILVFIRELFGFEFKIVEIEDFLVKYPWVIISLSMLSCFFLGFFIRMMVYKKRQPTIFVTNDTPLNFSETLLAFFESKRAKKEYAEIIRWGIAVSNPLSLSQKYEIRRKIGQIVNEASIRIDNNTVRAKTLIEDIGWTSVEMTDYVVAEKKLKMGVDFARKNDELYLLAKGYRYLFSLYLRQGLLTKAEEYLNMSLEVTNILPIGISLSEAKKQEIIAEYYFAKSSLEHQMAKNSTSNQKKKLFNALLFIDKATEEYSVLNDKEWQIKIMARKGEILITKGELDEAEDIFIKGLEESEKSQFNRQIVKNLIGLGICSAAKGNLYEAAIHFDNADDIANNMGMYYELDIIKTERNRLKINK